MDLKPATVEDRKDMLIAWAYRHFKSLGNKRGSQGDEFLFAAEQLVPDVQTLSASVAYHADMATRE